ncbi:MAG: hypothetical protein IJ001_10850 [Oscillospiraceae bacterium]|nr:hypothetical protein [Oscillospiraceae bacterium]
MPAWFANFLESCLEFSGILNASITASWVVLAVLILRFLLKKAPKWTHVALWGLVALRLLLPFSIESVFSLIPSTETLPTEILTYGPVRHSEPARLDIITNPAFSEPVSVELPQTVERIQWDTMYLSFLWWAGIALMVLYTLISYWRLRRRVSTAVRLRDNIWQSEQIPSPFVLGIFRPRIYLPFSMGKQDMAHVIAHEQAHIRRKDHWWKPLGFLLLTFHWFNPILWLAYILLCRDIELACDEKVIKTLGTDQRADYSEALLKCSVKRGMIAACPLAFGEVGVKERVKNVLNYKKPAFWIVLIAVIACIVVAVCFLTNPVNSSVVNPWVQEYVPGTGNILGSVDTAYYESISPDFAIGADQYGRAVYKDPHQAFQTFKMLYAEGIRFVREQEDLPPLTQATTNLYKKFGWQVTGGTEEQQEQARFVTRFLDIYENSFSEDIPVSDEGMEPTKEVLSLEKVVELAEKGENLGWEDFEGYASEEIGSGLYILRYEIDDVFHLRVGGVPDEAPWYIRLCTNSTNEYIDLTTNDPLPFIQHYSGDYSASDIQDIHMENGYTVTDQQDAEISLSIRSSVLTDACYTEEGQDFAQGEVIAYQDSSTCIWLKRVQAANEGDDKLYFTFQSSFDIGDNGSVLSVHRKKDGNVYGNAVSVIKPVVNWTVIWDAVSLRGEGPGEQFSLYVDVDVCRNLVGRMNIQVSLNKVSYQKKLAAPETASDSLEEAISAAILAHFDTNPEDGLIHVESHVVLANEQKTTLPFFWIESRVTEETVYLLVMHESYRTDSGEPEAYGGTYVPTAITFKVDTDGAYTLKEYWEPRDGSYYTDDIKAKFPGEAADAVWADSDGYSVQLEEENFQKAQAYVAEHGTTYTTVEYLLREILPYDATAKNPQMWLDESPEEYEKLLSFGEGTLYYCFSQFLEGGQTDMRGHIMSTLCQQIMEQWSESCNFKGGGQDWFDAFRLGTEALLSEKDLETIQKHNPGAYLLLEMTAAIIPTPATFAFQNGEDLLSSAAVTLQEDGTFWLTFSPLSSYIGHGDYVIENNRLLLPTEDGMFTYVFDIVDENTLAFDAEASPEMTWFSNLYDGAVFTRTIQSGTDVAMTPLEELPNNYNAEQAGIDGCLVIHDDCVHENQEVWDLFLSDAKRGQPAFVRVCKYSSERRETAYETEIFDLYYNGSIYTLDFKESSVIPDGEYKYLRRFYEEVTDGSVDYDACERYILTNDPEASWEEIWRSAASSISGDLIEHYVAYSNLFYYADHPTIPELRKAELKMDGVSLAAITDGETLAQLEALLTAAEGLGYEPKTYNSGITMELTAVGGEQTMSDLMLDSDLVIIDNCFYDYGPGYTDVGTYNGLPDLLALFGLDRWPDVVYEKYADWLGPIPSGEAETEPADDFPQGSMGVWHPNWTYTEITGKHPITILESLGSMVLVPTDEPQPDVEDAEYTLHIAFDSGEEFDLVYIGNDRFFYRIFQTQQVYTFVSPDLRQVIENAIEDCM